ncbi:MAG TPA: phage head closure protein [Amaricoccus sp.]|uniref:phage head closure protein n=1 Tax=Amaricoccus sp. TaxID=1872485 RepID=UPI002B9D268C|nr:phage head closure protein [Amaricoccus sp.]HMQ94604.1 phage head closure protein [Amaricoccus sp.]HMR52444.1 phage head closure protein [Amaricoccus sp.]HMR61403.1 phage head closure protein [Amaricoccus sp.]HMT99400.1 phage head closure protein [Amaricoccus sp.]
MKQPTAGRLDRRITIERPTYGTDAFGGAPVSAWVPIGTVWAEVTPVSDGERWRAAELAAVITTRFRIRWGLGVTVEDRIIYGGREYAISGVKELGRQRWQELTASARGEAP